MPVYLTALVDGSFAHYICLMEQLILMHIPPYQLPLGRIPSKNMINCRRKKTTGSTGVVVSCGIARVYEVTYKGEIEAVFQVAIKWSWGTSSSSDTLTSGAKVRSFVPIMKAGEAAFDGHVTLCYE